MNDWMHTIFENDHCPSYLKRRAQNLIGAQIVLSVYGLIHFGSVKSETIATLSCIFGLLFSVMSLSNATKNKMDYFSSLTQSYSTKLGHALSVVFIAIN